MERSSSSSTTHTWLRAVGVAALQVVVRCRPLNDKEQADGRQRIVNVDARQGQILVSTGSYRRSLEQ